MCLNQSQKMFYQTVVVYDRDEFTTITNPCNHNNLQTHLLCIICY